MGAEALLETRGLGLSIADRELFRGLNLKVREGESWGILGPNGSGKTSLLHALGGLRRADHGDVFWRGRSLADIPPRERAREIGMMLQNEDAVFPTTVLERTLAGRHPHLPLIGWETARDVRMAREALALSGLKDFEGRLVPSLSGGERRRLQIAALVCQAPRLALLDEPENDLDLGCQNRLLKTVAERFTHPDHALVMVLHDINLACRLCSHLVLLGNGMATAGDTDTLATEARLSALYDCEVIRVQGPSGPLFVAG